MAALVAGVQYDLTSQGHFNDNKTLIFVKLTDSSLRAIEEYLKNRNKCSQTPTIQFLGNEGHLSFPSSQPRSRAGFKFSLSNNADIEGPQGSFECVHHLGQRFLESVGALPCKMRIQANDDVYEATRNRMAAAEKQFKENCTREIELDKAAGIGRRVKVRSKMVNGGGGGAGGVRRGGGTPPPPSALPPSNSNHPPPSAPPALHNTSPHTKPQGNNHAQKPGNPEIMKKPIRDRIVHLLAVRPYKKPELYMALSRDGLRDKDKSNLTSTIMSVATIKENTYHLMRHVWNDVQEDWPFYSEQDRQMLKRRKPENLTPPGSSDGGSSVESPGSPPSGAEPHLAKRPGYYDGADGLPTKRQRISHYKKPSSVSLSNSTSGTIPNHHQPHTNHLHNNHHQPPPPSSIDPNPPLKLPDPSPPTPPQETTPPKYSSTDYPKYLYDYTTIKDIEQRRRYKEAFNANYNEYKQLHSLVERVSKRFALLDEQLKREERGSAEWQRIKAQIMKEYNENKKDTKHHDAKRRFHYLHEKLSHIKRLVIDYDSKEFVTT